MIETLLGGLSPQQFLSEYWQKKPLLIANALPEFESPIDPDELAGLACEDEVESRIILERDGLHPWELRHGPFSEEDFTELPETHWSLLIQECNKYIPELAQLLEWFNFIPNWRVDDVMVSYAPRDGSVGPHTDQYDVFLIQALGTRRWQINNQEHQPSELLPDLDLRILKNFHAEQEWIVKPGDILYLPPGVAHYGVALEDCMTLSVGFRAPAQQDLLTHFVDYLGSRISSTREPRYSDPDLTLQQHPGEITIDDIAKVGRIIEQAITNNDLLPRWFGQFATTPKNEVVDVALDEPLDATAFLEKLFLQKSLYRSEYSRFAFIKIDPQQIAFYIDGIERIITGQQSQLVMLICDRRYYSISDLTPYLDHPACISELVNLTNAGMLYFQSDDE